MICSPSVTTSCTFRKYNHLTGSAIANIRPVILPTRHSTSSPRFTVIVISPPTCRSSTLPRTSSSTSVISTDTSLPAWVSASWPWVSSTTLPVIRTSHGSSKRTTPLLHLGSRPQSTILSQLISSSCSAITPHVQLSPQAPLALTIMLSVKLALTSPSRSLEVCILGQKVVAMLTHSPGHTHIRDFVVYDDMATGLESGRYCETLGWFSMTGFGKPYNKTGPASLPHPTQAAIKINATSTASSSTVPLDTNTNLPTVSASPSTGAVATAAAAPGNYTFHYFRRYLDWNRLTFEFHANGSQSGYAPIGSSSSVIASTTSTSHASSASATSTSASTTSGHAATTLTFTTTVSTCPAAVTVHPSPVTITVTETGTAHAKRQLTPAAASVFDTPQGVNITNTIYADRHALNLTTLYGCAPQSWCQTCAPFMSSGNIFSLLSTALATVVYEPSRQTVPRIILLNTGRYVL